MGRAGILNENRRQENPAAEAQVLRDLAGMSILDERDQFDFDQNIFGEAGDFDGGAGRGWGAGGGQMLGVDGVHGREVVEVFEEDGGFDDLGEAAAGGFEDGFEVGEDLRGLLIDAAWNDLLCFGMERDLAGGEDQVAGANCLRIGADGFGSFVGGDDGAGGDGEFFAHGGIVAGVGREGQE